MGISGRVGFSAVPAVFLVDHWDASRQGCSGARTGRGRRLLVSQWRCPKSTEI